MVRIANPIYDVVFKYLMNDDKVARLLLSAILGKEVVSLDFRPTEQPLSLGETLIVLRMDFTARIVDDNGREELVILELQKAKLPTDILRFRRYLGLQYSNENNMVREGESAGKALPIISVYFLGHKLEHTTAPVVRVNRKYIDAATGEEILEKEEFIESLTHDSVIIQIPYLKGHRRTELEQILSLFDQSYTSLDPHYLHIDEEELPERYRPLLRRLQKALSDPELLQIMNAEDDLIDEFKYYQRKLMEKELLLREKEKALVEKDTMELELDRKLTEKQQELTEEKMRLKKAVCELYAVGTEVEKLSLLFGLTTEEVKAILNSGP